MWYWRATKAQVQVSLVPTTLSPCIVSITTCKLESGEQFSTRYIIMCHGISGHVAEQSMSLNVK